MVQPHNPTRARPTLASPGSAGARVTGAPAPLDCDPNATRLRAQVERWQEVRNCGWSRGARNDRSDLADEFAGKEAELAMALSESLSRQRVDERAPACRLSSVARACRRASDEPCAHVAGAGGAQRRMPGTHLPASTVTGAHAAKGGDHCVELAGCPHRLR